MSQPIYESLLRQILSQPQPGPVLVEDLRTHGPPNVQVDRGAPVVLDDWYDRAWGACPTAEKLAEDLPLAMHHIRIELLTVDDNTALYPL